MASRSNHRSLIVVAGLSLVCSLGSAAVAGDWPQWRGPQRNGVSSESGWLTQWPAEGPKRLWSAEIGTGFSTVAVAGNRVYTFGNTDGQDAVTCLDADTGKPVWKQSYASPPKGDPIWEDRWTGPRATPTVDGDRVYVMSHRALALCLDAKDGKVLWQQDLQKASGSANRFGYASSPLVEGELVLYNTATAGVALNRQTGEVAWKSEPFAPDGGYASPVPFTQSGKRAVIFPGFGQIVAVEPATGKELWRQRFPMSADPIVVDDMVFLTIYSAIQSVGGCKLLRLGEGEPTVVWQGRSMCNEVNSSVLVDGFLYGNDKNSLKCVNLKTGEERWTERGFGKGGLMAAGGKLIALTERGELRVVDAKPDAYSELAKTQLPRGLYWTHPILANGRIYCRSQEGTLTCLDVRPGA